MQDTKPLPTVNARPPATVSVAVTRTKSASSPAGPSVVDARSTGSGSCQPRQPEGGRGDQHGLGGRPGLHRLSVSRGAAGQIARIRYVLPRHKATDWGELVQIHDDRDSFKRRIDELPEIDIHSL